METQKSELLGSMKVDLFALYLVLRLLKLNSNEIRIKVSNKNFIEVVQLDNEQISLVYAKIPSKVEDQLLNSSISINLENFLIALPKLSSKNINESITLTFDKELLHLKFREMETKLNYETLNTEFPSIDKIKLGGTCILLNLEKLKLNEFAQFSKYYSSKVLISLRQNNSSSSEIVFEVNSEELSRKVELPVIVKKDESSKKFFVGSILLLKVVTELKKLSNLGIRTITLYFGDDKPLLLQPNLPIFHGELMYYLAPIVEDNEVS
jgi:hypothetical protein